MRSTRTSLPNPNLRSHSANVYHSLHHQQFRMDDSQSYNRLKIDIKNSFDAQNKFFNDVKQLTSKVSPAHSEKINRICIKYSICPNPKRSKRSSEVVDVQFIARSYVRSKSKEKKRQDQKNELKQSIKTISRRYQKPKEKEFFKLETENLRELKLHVRSQAAHKQSHPYLKIYQKSQAEALANILHKNKINLGTIGDCPTLNQPEQWEKDQKQIKQMYATIKNLRTQNTKLRQKKNEINNDIFLT